MLRLPLPILPSIRVREVTWCYFHNHHQFQHPHLLYSGSHMGARRVRPCSVLPSGYDGRESEEFSELLDSIAQTNDPGVMFFAYTTRMFYFGLSVGYARVPVIHAEDRKLQSWYKSSLPSQHFLCAATPLQHRSPSSPSSLTTAL